MTLEVHYTTKEAAALLGLSPRTLENWRNLRQGPTFLKFGSRVLYAESALKAFAASNTITTMAVQLPAEKPSA
jgi:hypothetical protein